MCCYSIVPEEDNLASIGAAENETAEVESAVEGKSAAIGSVEEGES